MSAGSVNDTGMAEVWVLLLWVVAFAVTELFPENEGAKETGPDGDGVVAVAATAVDPVEFEDGVATYRIS